MINDIDVARVTPAQLSQLVHISRKTFTDAFAHLNNPDDMQAFLTDHLTAESLGTEMSNPESEFYFVVEDNQPIAFFKINTGKAQTELKADDGFEIERIYVLKEHQGKKLGHRIMNHCLDMALQRNKAYVWLGVWEHNANAIRFYENNGFVTFDKHTFLLGNDLQTDLMLKLELTKY